jgi:hypothetical protein
VCVCVRVCRTFVCRKVKTAVTSSANLKYKRELALQQVDAATRKLKPKQQEANAIASALNSLGNDHVRLVYVVTVEHDFTFYDSQHTLHSARLHTHTARPSGSDADDRH